MADKAEANKAVVRRFLTDSRHPDTGEWNLNVIREVFDVDRYYSHSWGAGLAETGRRMGEYFTAFEFIELVNDDLVAEHDFVVRRSTTRVRHVGEMLGVAPTNRVLTLHAVEIWRIDGGKIIEHWGGDGAIRSLYDQITAER